MITDELLLIDLSSLAHPIWHTSQSEPDPNATSQKVVERVRALASEHEKAAICCDSPGRSFRKEIDPTYKANRPESDATLQHQIALATEVLTADGFPVWKVPGFEADDLIASACVKGIQAGLSVLVVSADKDLLQLVDECIRQKRPDTNEILDADAVVTRFAVRPSQIGDYLSLVGDKSDNIRGADGIGAKKAAALLNEYDTLEGVYHALEANPSRFTPSLIAALRNFRPYMATTRKLVALQMDVPLPFEQALAPRLSKDSGDFLADAGDDMLETKPVVVEQSTEQSAPAVVSTAPVSDAQAVAVREPRGADIIAAPSRYELQLDPRSMDDARLLAVDMFKSRLFSAYGTPQGVLATIMLGRELGLSAMAALRMIHIIEGKQGLSAQLMVALVLKSQVAEYFEPISFDEEQATFETKRKGARNPVRLQHTVAMAERAQLLKKDSNWQKIPGDMVLARAQSRLCRLVYPDIIGGLYTPDELRELRDEMKAA